ncbi:hypothetical protein [Pseudomonas oryziphila]|uniref:Uncharacterized protein n=1 Tax=Pseudomonas entomophila TaxID=312306 RepID=A0A3Q8U0V9_9PSED|nr:hypothetical protein [Pseudomonas oryziphila]AZL68822.1 hypothetical protein EJA05_14250 [Pseudomonas oryziphila]
MAKNDARFDKACIFNIAINGNKFRSLVRQAASVENLSVRDVEVIAAYAYGFSVEYQVVDSADLPSDLAIAMQEFIKSELGAEAKGHVEYVQYSMLIGVMRYYLQGSDFVSIKNLPGLMKKAQDANKLVSQNVDSKLKEVKELEDALTKLKTKFNFVGLSQAFGQMRNYKRWERLYNFIGLILLGGAMISPAIAKIYCYYFEVPLPPMDIYTAVSVAALELLLVFFFRVALHNFRAVKAQILQLDLRVALVQFIQDYAKYVKGQKNEGGVSLEKFEQVVFSGLVSGESDLPSTFDGLDGLAKIIKNLKK